MKTLAQILLIVAGLGLLAGPTACSTTPDGGDQSPRVERISKAVGLNAGFFVLENNPDRTAEVAAIAATLETLATDDGLDLVELYAAIDRLGLAKIEGGLGVLIVSNGQLLLEEVGGGEIGLDRLKHSQALARGMAAGIRTALELKQ